MTNPIQSVFSCYQLAILSELLLPTACRDDATAPANTKSDYPTRPSWWVATKDYNSEGGLNATFPEYVGIGEYKTDNTYDFPNPDPRPDYNGTWAFAHNESRLMLTSALLNSTLTVDIDWRSVHHLDFKAARTNQGTNYQLRVDLLPNP